MTETVSLASEFGCPEHILCGDEARPEYLEYARGHANRQLAEYGHVFPKLAAQLELQTAGIGDWETWMVPFTDYSSARNIVQSLLARGRKRIWFGVATKHDGAYPQTFDRYDKGSSPPLFKFKHSVEDKFPGVNNLEEFDTQWQAIEAHAADPEKGGTDFMLKIFPQDFDVHIGNMLVLNNQVDFELQPGTLDARERKVVYTYSFRKNEFTHNRWALFTKHDVRHLIPLFKSMEMWEKFDDITRVKGPMNFISPEFMTPRDGWDKSITFINDYSYGAQLPGKDELPPVGFILSDIARSQQDIPVVHYRYLSIFEQTDQLRGYFAEATEGTPPNQIEMLHVLRNAQAISHLKDLAFALPLAKSLVEATQAGVNPLNGNQLISEIPTLNRKPRLNMLMMSERPSVQDVATLSGYPAHVLRKARPLSHHVKLPVYPSAQNH